MQVLTTAIQIVAVYYTVESYLTIFSSPGGVSGDIDQLLVISQELKSPYGVYLRLVLF